MERITVPLGKRSYSITIASGLLNNLSSFFPLKKGDRAMLVTNEILAPLYLNKVCQVLEEINIKVDSIILPDGEQYKSLMTLNTIFTTLLQKLHGRDTTLIALGGGVIGDLTGFAAASYQRGVRFIQVPTTLLSQVDSSVGGKTAINHPLGKNMIGAFYQPVSVVIDLEFLKTLPIRELISGLAEVIKYGITLDAKFFSWLEENIDALLLLDDQTTEYCIRRCCELKAGIIAIDEHENNLRTLLNLGHTYGHAIEAEMGYGSWLHGEAISAGMVMAAKTAERLVQKFTEKETYRIIKLLKRAGLPTAGPRGMSAQAYFSHMVRDKKVLAGELCLVLPIEIGKSKFYFGVPQDIILDVISSN